MSIVEAQTGLTEIGAAHAWAVESARAVLDYEPWEWLEATAWGLRRKKLKEKYGRSGAVPKKWAEVSPDILGALPVDILAQCKELVRLGLEPKAIRLAYCCRLGRIYACSECGRPGKRISRCKSRMCAGCAKGNFDTLFRRFLQVDRLIPATVRSLPGWTWDILDFSFHHDGDFPKRWELRAMVEVIRRTVPRAVREACPEWFKAGQGCRLRLDGNGEPMRSVDGWPIGGAPDGEGRELVGWVPVFIPEHMAPDNAARKGGERGAKKKIPARWKLCFGWELVRVTEFGFDSVNAHFHGAYFGPRLDFWKEGPKGHEVFHGRLVQIFKEESRKALGVESWRVLFEPAKRGFRSVLAHALKYTGKIPVSTPEGYAQLEYVLQGTRRVTLLGAHYGVPLESKPLDPVCSTCGSRMGRLDGLGLVPLSEIVDLPDVVVPVSPDDPSAGEFADEEFSSEQVRGP